MVGKTGDPTLKGKVLALLFKDSESRWVEHRENNVVGTLRVCVGRTSVRDVLCGGWAVSLRMEGVVVAPTGPARARVFGEKCPEGSGVPGSSVFVSGAYDRVRSRLGINQKR